MNSIKTYLNSLGRGARVLVLSLAVIFGSAAVVQAATTISTSILTNGTLGVTGVSTFGGTASTTISVAGVLTTPSGATALFLGGASTTQFTLLSGDTIKNATASSTVLSGSLTVGGGTGSATLTVTNTANATSTATVGCVVTTATSSATQIKLLFNTVATSTTINGASVAGFVLWAYGSNCTN
ncbi:hypothetical protein A3A36_00305 [Candidatus Kaiserbacteria bacterium RIFCSPLOWO2_01_FULL_52_12b]|uniref:Uncharacterized protein n=1 Tax=Candidatus Kaiserbacteria bacterium RIFCSPLOWO2_01_FULL_52_12b TaxID=1798509 RepID=A0A1F6EXW6_9BACT|nr:MAG: hypothetical protein A3A36_00305 [Candidatus Kaiserbacteria bacterium RIFCSPLOWO2_01_FULL_52_12b]